MRLKANCFLEMEIATNGLIKQVMKASKGRTDPSQRNEMIKLI